MGRREQNRYRESSKEVLGVAERRHELDLVMVAAVVERSSWFLGGKFRSKNTTGHGKSLNMG